MPTVEGSNESAEVSDTSTHTVNLPASIASGELILVFFAIDGNPTLTFPDGSWGQKKRLVESANSHTLEVWQRTGTGGEAATIDVTSSASQESSHATYRISTANHSVIDISTGTEGDGLTADADSLTPSGGSNDYLWFAAAAGDATGEVASAPTSYINLQTIGSGGVPSVGIGVASQELTASVEDPAVFGNWQATGEWVVFTVAISPPATGPVVELRGSIPIPGL